MAEAGPWRIAELRFDLDWQHGTTRYTPGWVPAQAMAGWFRDWREPAVSAELDSPSRAIHKSQNSLPPDSVVQEAYIRCAWALDQADFGLLATAFADQAHAEMSPFGPMKGQRQIVASLKTLREGQPYMQHAAAAMEVDIDGDTAQMQIFRAIPFTTTRNSLDQPLCGARYDSRLRREDGVWRFEWLHYTPGWARGPKAVPGPSSEAHGILGG